MEHAKVKCLITNCTEIAVMHGRCMKCYYGTRRGTRKGSRFFKDIDYWNKLSKEEVAWLQKFVAEEYDNNIGKVLPFNKKKSDRKVIYNRDYARRVDLTLHHRELAIDDMVEMRNPENALIELIDLKAQLKKKRK